VIIELGIATSAARHLARYLIILQLIGDDTIFDLDNSQKTKSLLSCLSHPLNFTIYNIYVFFGEINNYAVVKMTCLNDVHTVHKSIVKEAIK